MDPKNIFILLFSILISLISSVKSEKDVVFLEPGKDRVIFRPENKKNAFGFPPAPVLRIYCCDGRDKNLLNLFNTVTFHIDIDDDDFQQFGLASEPEQIREDYQNQKSLFSFSLLSRSKKRVLKFNPFNSSCIGIESANEYKVFLQLIRIDFWRVSLMITGFVFVFLASKLSQNSLFYYLCGVLLGVFASFLVLIYFLSKLIPKKSLMYGMMASGWTLAIYFGQMVFENIQPILVTYQTYVFWYIVITGCVSFIICYRMGPPKNQRSKDLIKWGLQVIGLFMVFYSSYFQEATLGLNLVGLVLYYFPYRYLLKLRSFWRKRFPPKPKLLTNDEYYEQGVRETTRALEELKAYCSSPECKQWKVMLKLKDPSRFASFIEGDPHVNDDELMDYETTIAGMDLSEDESSDEDSAGNFRPIEPPRSSRQGTPVYQQFSNRSQQISTSTPTNVNRATPTLPSRNTPINRMTPTLQTNRRMTPTIVNGVRNRLRQNGTTNSRHANNDLEISDDDN